MPSQRKPQADRHKNPPFRVRLPEDDRAWVLDTAAAEDRAVNAVIVDAVREKRQRSAASGTEKGNDQ